MGSSTKSIKSLTESVRKRDVAKERDENRAYNLFNTSRNRSKSTTNLSAVNINSGVRSPPPCPHPQQPPQHQHQHRSQQQQQQQSSAAAYQRAHQREPRIPIPDAPLPAPRTLPKVYAQDHYVPPVSAIPVAPPHGHPLLPMHRPHRGRDRERGTHEEADSQAHGLQPCPEPLPPASTSVSVDGHTTADQSRRHQREKTSSLFSRGSRASSASFSTFRSRTSSLAPSAYDSPQSGFVPLSPTFEHAQRASLAAAHTTTLRTLALDSNTNDNASVVASAEPNPFTTPPPDTHAHPPTVYAATYTSPPSSYTPPGSSYSNSSTPALTTASSVDRASMTPETSFSSGASSSAYSPAGSGPASPYAPAMNMVMNMNMPSSHPSPPYGTALQLAPGPGYDTIKIVAHKPEDVNAVRGALSHLQLTWSLYNELGRPANLAEAVERQLGVVSRAVDRLNDLPPFTITVPVADGGGSQSAPSSSYHAPMSGYTD